MGSHELAPGPSFETSAIHTTNTTESLAIQSASSSRLGLNGVDKTDEPLPFQTLTPELGKGCSVPMQAHENALFSLQAFYELSRLLDTGTVISIESTTVPIPAMIPKTKNGAAAISSAEVERRLSLINIICTSVRNSLKVDHMSGLMTINLLGKESEDQSVTPSVKMSSTIGQLRHKSTKAFGET